MTTAPSRKTSYVIVGENAGSSKLTKIKDLGLEAINEDQFLDLIRERQGQELDDKQIKAMEKEQQKITEAAEAMAKREVEEEKLQKRKLAALTGTGIPAKSAPSLLGSIRTDALQESDTDLFAALDDEIRASKCEGDLWKQSSGRATAAMARKLVCSLLDNGGILDDIGTIVTNPASRNLGRRA